MVKDDYIGRPLQPGMTFTMRGGDIVEVVSYENANSVLVEFKEYEIYRATVSKKEILTGTLRNAYKPTIFDRGYIGVGEYYGAESAFEYATWWGIFRRCYEERSLVKAPLYRGCYVDESWYNFQTFAHWLRTRKQAGMGWQIDKDLLIYGNKEYSESTCCLLPPEINTFLAYSRSTNKTTSNLPGVYWDNKSGKYRGIITFKNKRENLGLSSDPYELYALYKEAKERQAKLLGSEWKEHLDKEAYDALMSWEVKLIEGVEYET